MTTDTIATQTDETIRNRSRKARGWKPVDLVLWPFWLLLLFTGAKNFRDNPMVGSRLLNRLGLHKARMFLSYWMTAWRRLFLRGLAAKAYRDQLHQDGLITVEGFLNPRDLKQVSDYLAWHQGPARRHMQRDTATDQIILDDQIGHDCQPLHKIRHSRQAWGLLCYASSRLYIPSFFLQRIQHRDGTEAVDPQKTLHSDTFHSTMKAWLFLEDVTLEKGPFHYVKGSHRPTGERATWETAQALTVGDGLDTLSAKGSMRLSDDGIKAMDLPDATPMTVKAGTLVIADTHGWHGRGLAKAGATRLAIWTSNRATPFMPVPLGLLIPEKIQHAAIRWNYERQEKQAARAGKTPVWEEISAREMLD